MRFETVSPNSLSLLRELMRRAELSQFSLGGGTSLALRFGHRKSIDIDLFSTGTFDSDSLLQGLHSRYSDLQIFNRTMGSLCLEIEGVNVDLLQHSYGELEAPSTIDGIRFVSLADIAAMKINAVTNRGSKKDFSDLLLLHHNALELGMALQLFCRKYGRSSKFLAIRSLQFFDDARQEPDPLYLNGWTWPDVELEMNAIVDDLIRAEQI